MKKNKTNILIIVLLSIVVMLPLILDPNGLGHDTIFHVANIDSIKLDLETSLFPNRISQIIGNSFGYGTHLFYPMLPHMITGYLAKLTSLFQINTPTTIIIMYGIITFLSAILIYCIGKKITKKNSLALLSSIIFLFMPYRLGDIVVRCAFNEVFTFLFMPLVILGVLYLIEDNKKMFYLSFITGCVGLLYSHLVITLFFALLMIPFVIIYHKKFLEKDTLKTFFTAISIIILIALPGILPMIEHRLKAEYMIYIKDYMTNIDYMKSFNLHILDYIKIGKDYSWDIPFYINYIVIGLLLVRLFFYIKEKKKEKNETFLWIFTFLALFISLNIFPWDLVPKFLYFIQFPWRMETMLVISISLLAPLAIQNIKVKKIKKWIVIGIIVLIPCTEIPLIIKLSNDIYQIGVVIPNNGMGHSKEYLPKKAFENEIYFEYRGQDIMLVNGDAKIIEIENTPRKIEFELETDNNETTLEFPRLYYLGYHIKTKDGEVLSLEESNNGFLQAKLKGNGIYTLVYEGTTLNKISNLLCILGIGGFGYLIISQTKKKTNRT